MLFVGEGDFSFTVAFAALRKSGRSSSSIPDLNPGTWDGIVATRFESDTHTKPPSVFSEVVDSCKKSSEEYHVVHGSTESLKKKEKN